MKHPSHVYIVGAGFSKHAGLPLQMDFTEKLLEARNGNDTNQKELVEHLAEFIHHAFDHNKKAKSKFWPELEDIFTNVDMAANSGHHLSKFYDPARLRNVRRILLSRIMYMLDESYKPDKQLKKFFEQLTTDSSAFISMNWDTVIERGLHQYRGINSYSYKCEDVAAKFPVSDNQITKRVIGKEKTPIVKMHGSANWLYCDNCRRLFWFDPKNAQDVAFQILTSREIGKLSLDDETKPRCGKWECCHCEGVKLTTRIATFSYLKALDFPMFQRSWLAAEDLLLNAKKWVFIGYSLPAADYEFKHLLKRVQLARSEPPEFVIITGDEPKNDEQKKNSTYANYQRFFGRKVNAVTDVFYGGLTDAAIKKATS